MLASVTSEDRDEFDARIGLAIAAPTHADLATVTADLQWADPQRGYRAGPPMCSCGDR